MFLADVVHKQLQSNQMVKKKFLQSSFYILQIY